MRHGLRSETLSTRLAEEQAAFYDAALADDGGRANVPIRRASLLDYRARTHVHIRQVSDALAHLGLFDRRGKLRVAWIQRLEGLMTVAIRLDATLGLARRAKLIDPRDEIAARVAALGEEAEL